MERLRNQGAMRNRLVHYQTKFFLKNEEGRRIALCPWAAPKNRDREKPPPNALLISDIVKARLEFAALVAVLGNFSFRVAGLPVAPFPKSDEQASSPPTAHQLVRRIHEALGHPQKSSKEKRREEEAKNAAASLKIEIPEVKVEIDGNEPSDQTQT